jgi:hypothetical protein
VSQPSTPQGATEPASSSSWRRSCTWLALALAIELGLQIWGALAGGIPLYFAPFGLVPSVLAFGVGWLLARALLGGPAPGRLGLAALARAEVALAGWSLTVTLAGEALRRAQVTSGGTLMILAVLLNPVLVPWIAARRLRGQQVASRGRVVTWLVLLVVLQLAAVLAGMILWTTLVLTQSHSERCMVSYEPPWLAAPDPREETWPEAGAGYVVFSGLAPGNPQYAGLRALADRRGAQAIVQLPPAGPGGDRPGLEAWLGAEIDRLRPRHVLFVAQPDEIAVLVPVANRVICDPRGPRAGLGFLPASEQWDLQAYAARVQAREAELAGRSAPVRSAVIVVEVGRFITPLCHVHADELGRALGLQGVPGTVIRYDNSQASWLEPERAATLAEAGILALIGHGNGTYAAGIQAANLPAVLRGHPVVVNGACFGGAVAKPATLALELFQRGALLQAAGTATHGWIHVAPFLEHAWRGGRSAGEAWARTLVELRRAADAGHGPDLTGRWVARMAGLPPGGTREAFEQSILIGDPALVPFPAEAPGLRGSLLAR